MTTQKVYGKVLKNSVFNAIGRIYFMTYGFLFTPYLLSRLGFTIYGIYVLITTLKQYVGLTGLSALSAFIGKMVPEYNAKNDIDGINKLFTIGFTLSGVAFMLVGLLAYPLVPLIVKLFNIKKDLYNIAYFVFAAALAIIAVNIFLTLFYAFIIGLQKMEITNGIMMAMSLVQVSSIIYLLEHGYGIKGVVMTEVATISINTCILAYFTFKFIPGLKFKFSYFDTALLKRMVKYNFFTYVAHISAVINFQLDNLLLANFISLPAVTNYQLGGKVSHAARSLPNSVVSSILPAAAEINTSHGKDEVYKMYFRLSRWMTFLCFPLFFFLGFSSHRFMSLWVGPGFWMSAGVLSILSLGYMTNIVFGVASSIVHSMERPDIEARASFLVTILNLIFSISLIRLIGFWGAPIGTTMAMFIASTYLVFLFHKFINKPVAVYFKEVFLQGLVPTLSSLVPLILIEGYVLKFRWLPDRPENLALIAAEFVVFALTYITIISLGKALNEEEIVQLKMVAVKIAAKLPVFKKVLNLFKIELPPAVDEKVQKEAEADELIMKALDEEEDRYMGE